ncbi:MAG: response regulator transcription factor [Proteobacteria bacterium]|nr:response regulator transcription factor [Pseudomonadota bacterium]
MRGVGEESIRILLADDHPIFAEALQTLIERSMPASSLTIVGDLAAAHRALAAAPRYDLAILDLHMPGANGFDGIERTLARFPDTKLVVISGAASAADVSRAIGLGAKGFLPKTLPGKVITAALQVVASGGTYVPADYAQPGRASPPRNAEEAASGLTPRETEVLALLSTGQSNKEIGRALDLQEVTVKLHVRNVFRKLGVRNRVEATNAAVRLNLAAPRR